MGVYIAGRGANPVFASSARVDSRSQMVRKSDIAMSASEVISEERKTVDEQDYAEGPKPKRIITEERYCVWMMRYETDDSPGLRNERVCSRNYHFTILLWSFPEGLR